MRQALDDATRRLAAAGVTSPRIDAELLLAYCLGVERSQLSTVAGPAPSEFTHVVQRRAAREPLQYIVGRAAFRYVDVAVGPGVFIPRPETELLVDAVLPALAPGPTVVDLCAGSGALAVAIAHEVPGARVYAVEPSRAALPWLRRNAAATGLTVVDGDVTDPSLLDELSGLVDAVVSNPPYVPAGTLVEPEVRADPADAVFAGVDGLAVIPAVIARAAQLLRPGGVLALEHDETHAHAVPALLGDGWRDVADHRDLTGRPRYATAMRAAAR
ncbi:MAG TPA: peptide chain release factor N(5)-glutamine methyltransferase [Jatrophihabitantaceae bacterium]